MTDKHPHPKKIGACPKCSNTKDLMVIPGQGITFYYCPACYERDKKPTKTVTPTRELVETPL